MNRPVRIQHARQSVSATRTTRAKSSGLVRRVLLRLCLLASGMSALVAVVVWAEPLDHLRQIANRPIAGVVVEGEFRYLSQAKMQAALNGRIAGSFLQLDMEALKQSIEENPWVDSASVSRQWPDRLVIRVKEQQPIARWGKTAFLNMRGDIIDVKDNAPLSHLPLLAGDDRHAREVMEKYVRIARLLSPAELSLKEVRLDDTLSWALQLRNGIQVRVGREQVFEKLQRLLLVYSQELANRTAQIESIDLRYDNGLAVAWKDAASDTVVAENQNSTHKASAAYSTYAHRSNSTRTAHGVN